LWDALTLGNIKVAREMSLQTSVTVPDVEDASTFTLDEELSLDAPKLVYN
jgi:hypothetical protein